MDTHLVFDLKRTMKGMYNTLYEQRHTPGCFYKLSLIAKLQPPPDVKKIHLFHVQEEVQFWYFYFIHVKDLNISSITVE